MFQKGEISQVTFINCTVLLRLRMLRKNNFSFLQWTGWGCFKRTKIEVPSDLDIVLRAKGFVDWIWHKETRCSSQFSHITSKRITWKWNLASLHCNQVDVSVFYSWFLENIGQNFILMDLRSRMVMIDRHQ